MHISLFFSAGHILHHYCGLFPFPCSTTPSPGENSSIFKPLKTQNYNLGQCLNLLNVYLFVLEEMKVHLKPQTNLFLVFYLPFELFVAGGRDMWNTLCSMVELNCESSKGQLMMTSCTYVWFTFNALTTACSQKHKADVWFEHCTKTPDFGF